MNENFNCGRWTPLPLKKPTNQNKKQSGTSSKLGVPLPKKNWYFGKPKNAIFELKMWSISLNFTNSVQNDNFWSIRLIQHKHSSKYEQFSRGQQIHPRMTNWAQNDNRILE